MDKKTVALRRERLEVRKSTRPLIEKLGRGERLSFAERRDMDAATARIADVESQLLEVEEREISAAESAGFHANTAGAPAFEDRSKPQARRAWDEYIRFGTMNNELRAAPDSSPPDGQYTSSNAAGGYLVPPGWWQRLQIALKAYGGTAADFQLIETPTGQPMQWATANPTAIIGTILSEATQVQEQDYTFGQGTLGAYLATSGVQLVSRQLAQDSAFDTDSFIGDRVNESLGRAHAQFAMTGTGSSQPLGICTALNGQGSVGTAGGTIAQTGGFVTLVAGALMNRFDASASSTANSDNVRTELVGNSLSPATLLSMVSAVDPAYKALGCKFYMNEIQRIGLGSLTDSLGRQLFPSVLSDSPSIFGYPITIDQNIPNLTASTTGGPIFGHLASAMVNRRVAGASVLRLDERYADFLQIGYIGYMRFDTRSNDLRAAVTVKCAAS